jgi:hypothetical protein
MLFLILFMLVPAGIVGYAVWPAVRDSWKKTGRPSSAPADAGPAAPAEPESVEGMLVGQLAAGEISRRRYIRAMERLAARDDKRHPVAVPPETGSEA